MPMKNMYIGTINPNPQFDQYLGTAMPYGKGSTPTPKWWEEFGELANYVVSDGVTNYINPALRKQNNMYFEIDLEYLTLGGEKNFLGNFSGSGSTRQVVEVGSVTGDSAFFAYTSVGRWTIPGNTVATNTRYQMTYDFRNGSQKYWVDGSFIKEETQAVDITDNSELSLFSRNFSSTRIHTKTYSVFCKDPVTNETLIDLKPFYISKKAMTDAAGRVHAVGTFVLIDDYNEVVPATYGNAMQGGRPSLMSIESNLGHFSFDTFAEVIAWTTSVRTTLTDLKISGMPASDDTLMTDLCRECSNLVSFDGSGLDTSNVTAINNIFYACVNLTSCTVPWDVSKVTNIGHMFSLCEKLPYLDLSTWRFSVYPATGNFVRGCVLLDIAYGATQTECDIYNASGNKPDNVNFVVKPAHAEQTRLLQTQNEVESMGITSMHNTKDNLKILNEMGVSI